MLLEKLANKVFFFQEFGKGFREFGCELTKEEVAELFTIFDRNGSGFVDFEDMLCTLRQPMRQCRKDLVLKAFQKFDKGTGLFRCKNNGEFS